MKIGVLTTSYPRAAEDPSGHFVRGFSEWLSAHVGDVEVLALDAPPDPALRLRQGGLPERVRGASGLLHGAAITARLVAAARRRAHRWDAIVSHWLVPCGLTGDLVARGRRHLAIAHGSDVALLRALPGGSAIARRIARRADLVYVTGSLRIEDAPGRVVPMPALSPGPRRTAAEHAIARRELGLPAPGQGWVLLYCGRMIADKGIAELVAAVPAGAILLAVGDGPLLPEATPTTRVLGARFGADLRRCFAAADLLVVPSRRDGSPTVIAEARALGLPVLGTDVGGVRDAIGRDGLVCDPAGLAALLSDVVRGTVRLPDVTSLPRSWAEVGPLLWGSGADRIDASGGNTSISFY
jgi:glycosyltransferase involved in cell wall biosynthesis